MTEGNMNNNINNINNNPEVYLEMLNSLKNGQVMDNLIKDHHDEFRKNGQDMEYLFEDESKTNNYFQIASGLSNPYVNNCIPQNFNYNNLCKDFSLFNPFHLKYGADLNGIYSNIAMQTTPRNSNEWAIFNKALLEMRAAEGFTSSWNDFGNYADSQASCSTSTSDVSPNTKTSSGTSTSSQAQSEATTKDSSTQTSENENSVPLVSSVFLSAARETIHSFLKKRKQHCPFCKCNGEREMVYSSHDLKTEEGIIKCPVLRNYICPICYATGDNAHTLKYCPFKPNCFKK